MAGNGWVLSLVEKLSLALRLNLVLAVPKCLQIHETNITYQSTHTLLLWCYTHLGDMFPLIFNLLKPKDTYIYIYVVPQR